MSWDQTESAPARPTTLSDANFQKAALPLEPSRPTAAAPSNPFLAVHSDLPNATEPLGVTLGGVPGPSAVEDVLLVLLRALCRVNS